MMIMVIEWWCCSWVRAVPLAATDDDDAGHGWEQCLRYRCSLWWCWSWECVKSSEFCLNGKLWSPRLLTGSQRHRLHSWPTSSPSSFAEISKAPLSSMTGIVSQRHRSHPWPASSTAAMSKIHPWTQSRIFTIISQRHRSHPWPASSLSSAKGTALTHDQHRDQQRCRKSIHEHEYQQPSRISAAKGTALT